LVIFSRFLSSLSQPHGVASDASGEWSSLPGNGKLYRDEAKIAMPERKIGQADFLKKPFAS